MSKNYNKEETIRRHREMWNWIADKIEIGEIDADWPIRILKERAIQSLHPEDLKNMGLANTCYLCEYAQEKYEEYYRSNSEKPTPYRCHWCPLGYCKTVSPNRCLGGLYNKIYKLCDKLGYNEWDWRRNWIIMLAREIANLPERNFNDSKWKLLSKER